MLDMDLKYADVMPVDEVISTLNHSNRSTDEVTEASKKPQEKTKLKWKELF
jgi:hypothetical protein